MKKKRMAVLFALILLLLFSSCQGKQNYQVNQVALPERLDYYGTDEEAKAKGKTAQQQAWAADQASRAGKYQVGTAGLEELYRNLLQSENLEGKNGNKLISPMSFYFELSALAEMTEGETQMQILRLCGCESLEELQQQTWTIWNRIYQPNGPQICIPGTSVWLDPAVKYEQSVVDDLTEYDYAEVFAGRLSEQAMQKAASQWISEQSEGLLQLEDVFAEDTMLGVLSVLYYENQWSAAFAKENNFQDVFHGTMGDEQAEYMREERMGFQYYQGEGYLLVRKSLRKGYMWFALADEGKDTEVILKDDRFLSVISHTGEFEQEAKDGKVHLTLPKLDIMEETPYIEAMKEMGLEGLFDPGENAFAAFTDATAALSDVSQYTRMIVDEQGIKSAAATVTEWNTGDPSGVIVDVVLNRPFVFAVTGEAGLIYYVGVVNHVN